MCVKTGPELTDEELLFRHVYQQWWDNGKNEPSSQAFYPWMDNDNGCLSVDRGSMTTAADAHLLFTSPAPNGFGKTTVGVWALALSELHAEGVTAWEDRLIADGGFPANDAHALAEFDAHPPKKWKSIGRILKVRAIERLRQHP